jgi:hypothetical protein
LILQSGVLQRDLPSGEAVGDYAVAACLYFLPYFGVYIPPIFSQWYQNVSQKWGEHLLGVYYFDEPAGKMLDDYVVFQDTQTGDTITKTRYGDVAVEKAEGIVIHYEIGGDIHIFVPANFTSPNSDSLQFINKVSADVYASFYPDGTVTSQLHQPRRYSY